jgi:hypothetical protein
MINCFFLAKEINIWAKQNIGHIKTLAICANFLLWIDKQQKIRSITPLEHKVTQLVRERFSSLSILEDEL